MNELAPLILIVEDDRDMAQLNARLLKRQGCNVLIAYNAAEARQLHRNNPPDLYILDIELPDGNGLELCGEFGSESDAPVLFLTGKSETDDKVTGLGAGGDYYLTKPFERNELVAVVKSLLRRTEQTKRKLNDIAVITKGSVSLKIPEGKAFVNERDAGLTPKEFAVLLLLVRNEDTELTCEQIYGNVWGTAMNVDTGLIRKTISQIKKKLEIDEIDDFSILTRYGGGYTFLRGK